MKKEDTPLVTIIITTYRREKALKKAVISACEQDLANIEIIIVDDNADAEWNDLVRSIVKSVEGEQDRKLSHLINKENEGSARSRNIGINKAGGEYVTFLDDDDVYLESKVSQQLLKMIECDADFSLTDMMLYDDNERLKERRIRNDLKCDSGSELLKYHMMHHLTGNDTFMFKTEFIKSIGGYKKIDVGDDYYLIQKAILRGGRFVYIHDCQVKAYLHEGEDGGLSSGQRKIDGEIMLQNYKRKHFDILTIGERCYVWMRHYAVIAFAELRRKKYVKFIVYALFSFLWNPIGFISMLIKHI